MDTPNKDLLVKGVDIYRDSMRDFLTFHLPKAAGKTLAEAVKAALRDKRRDEFVAHMEKGAKVEDFIDICDFPHFLTRYAAKLRTKISGKWAEFTVEVSLACNARNTTSHPAKMGLGAAETTSYLYFLSKLLRSIGDDDKSEYVLNLREDVPGDRLKEGVSSTRKSGATAARPARSRGNPCACGCGDLVANLFAQGHDSKLRSLIHRVLDGKAAPDSIPQVSYDRLGACQICGMPNVGGHRHGRKVS